MRTMIGLLIYFVLIITRGIYKASHIFYRMAQDKNIFCMRFLDSYFGMPFISYDFFKRNINNESADLTRALYGDDDLEKYGKKNYNENAPLYKQQRGLILPLVKEGLEKFNTVVEIGTANGDVLAHLSQMYPHKNFIGVDFSIKNAMHKHIYHNLKFKLGYALDFLKQGDLKGDIVFANSTFMMFTPKELVKYLVEFNKAGFKQIIINEPNWGGRIQKNDDKAVSQHQEHTGWFHNYCGYLRKAGYEITYFRFFRYCPPGSSRPDVYEILVKGEKP